MRAFALLTLIAAACGQSANEDGRGDSFTVGGKADTGGIAEGTPDALGVLRVANNTDQSTLDGAVGLASNAAANIVAYRLGDDETAGTADDARFGTLAELDAVPYVGPVAFKKLLAYARANGFVHSAPVPPPDPTPSGMAVEASLPGIGIYCWQGCNSRDIEINFPVTVGRDAAGAITFGYRYGEDFAAQPLDANGSFSRFDPFTDSEGKGSISLAGHLEANRVLVIDSFSRVYDWTGPAAGREDRYESTGPASVHY